MEQPLLIGRPKNYKMAIKFDSKSNCLPFVDFLIKSHRQQQKHYLPTAFLPFSKNNHKKQTRERDLSSSSQFSFLTVANFKSPSHPPHQSSNNLNENFIQEHPYSSNIQKRVNTSPVATQQQQNSKIVRLLRSTKYCNYTLIDSKSQLKTSRMGIIKKYIRSNNQHKELRMLADSKSKGNKMISLQTLSELRKNPYQLERYNTEYINFPSYEYKLDPHLQ